MGAYQRYRTATPNDFGTCLVDLDFSRSDLITLNTGKVAQINGANGTIYNFANATGAQQPAYTASDSDFNNHGSASFTGGQLLSSTATVTGGATKCGLAMVIKRAGVLLTQVLWESSILPGGNPRSWTTDLDEAASTWRTYALGAANAAEWSVGSVADGSKYRLIQTWNYATASGANMQGYVDGAAVGSQPLATNTATTMGTFTWFLGSRNALVFPFQGKIARAIFYTSDIDVAGLDTWLRYLYT